MKESNKNAVKRYQAKKALAIVNTIGKVKVSHRANSQKQISQMQMKKRKNIGENKKGNY